MTISLTPTSFQIVPEGIHTFRIESVNYEEKFGRITIMCKTKDGISIKETYTLVNPTTRQPVEGAMKAFSYMCRVALQDWSVADIDPTILVGKFIAARVTHTNVQSNTRIGETITYANLGDKWACDGFDDFSKVKDREGNPIPLTNENPAPAPAPVATAPVATAPVETAPVAPAPVQTPVQNPAPAPAQSTAKSPFDLSALFGK